MRVVPGVRFALLGFALVVLSPAAAGELTISAAAPREMIRPEIDQREVVITLTLNCTDLGAGLQSGAKATLALTAPQDYLVFSGPMVVDVPTDECMENPIAPLTFQASIYVAATRSAPALEQIQVSVDANITPDQVSRRLRASTTFSLTVDYFSLFDVTTSRNLIKVNSDQEQVQIRLENYGNARTEFHFEFVDPNNPSSNSIILPPPMILESPTTGLTPTGANTTLIFMAPGGGWSQLATSIKITPMAADAREKVGNGLTINLLFRDQRGVFEKDIPGFGVQSGALILLAALLTRRRA